MTGSVPPSPSSAPPSSGSLSSGSLSSVEEARAQTLSDIAPLGGEEIPVAAALGRVLAQDIIAGGDLPPERVSAMDGYAVIEADVAMPGAQLRVVGEAPAGGRYTGPVGRGDAVRIFTGGPVPDGCERVVLQENVIRPQLSQPGPSQIGPSQLTPSQLAPSQPGPPQMGPRRSPPPEPGPFRQKDRCPVITIPDAQTGSAHIRAAGIDFTEGTRLCRKGTCVGAHLPGLIAAANCAEIKVYKKPRIGIISSGDELVPPGTSPGKGQIVNSAAFGLLALCQKWGADADILGILPDDRAAATAQLGKYDPERYEGLVTIGGASVGDRDLVKPALQALGAQLQLEKVALKPGKPYWTAVLGQTRIVGLPGNPTSAFVCAYLFLKPLIFCLTGRTAAEATRLVMYPTATPLPENGPRESYLRARLDDKTRMVEAFSAQDSSLLSTWAHADCLIQRRPAAPPVAAGAQVAGLMFD